MEYESQTKNAMILPIPTSPNPTEESVRFIDLKSNEMFFDQLNNAFPQIGPPPEAASKARSGGILPQSNSILKVFEVGDFVASVVPNVKDFSRLDPQFIISPETWDKIPEYSDYSFVVFQLEKLAGKPHPMTFEFKTRDAKRLFFPTVHIHDGEVHKHEEFDHVLYCQHEDLDAAAGSYTRQRDKQTGVIRSKGPAKDYVDIDKSKGLILPDLLIHKKTLRGQLPNRDTVLTAPARSASMSNTTKRFLAAGALFAAALFPLGWVIRRRQKFAADADSHQGET
ncbi:MAG: hypothetical protein AAF483_00230 [Planctomycetota bacterium]